MKTPLASSFHQPQPPSSCFRSLRRSRPALIFACRSAGLTRPERLSFLSVSATARLGRKLDMVCSVQSYG